MNEPIFEKEYIIIYNKKIPSINAGYLRLKNRVVLSPEAKNIKDKILQDMIKLGSFEDFKPFHERKDISLELDLIYLFKERYTVRDATNPTKFVEDAISKAIGINDSKNKKVSVSKIKNDIEDDIYEAIIIRIRVFDSYQDFRSLLVKPVSGRSCETIVDSSEVN